MAIHVFFKTSFQHCKYFFALSFCNRYVCHRFIQRRLAANCSILLGHTFRNKSSKHMALPHPKSRKDKYRHKDKPRSGSVVWNLFKRTINITEYRNAKDKVNPAENRTFGGFFHDYLSSIYFHYSWAALGGQLRVSM